MLNSLAAQHAQMQDCWLLRALARVADGPRHQDHPSTAGLQGRVVQAFHTPGAACGGAAAAAGC
eukprot:1158188-Pelagomonas_calceolata.AAC.1